MNYKNNKIMSFLLTLALMLFSMTAQAATTVGTLDALKTALNNGGDIQLTANIETSEFLYIKNTTQLDLNGFGILMTSNEPVIAVSSTLTISDSNPTKTNYLTLNSNGRATAIATSSSGAEEVKGGFIAGGTGHNGQGGGIYVNSIGQLEMTGGTIIGNTATNLGGGVSVGSGKFTMTGGSVTKNAATNFGGGVYVYIGALTMKGGTITNNTATGAAGVYVGSSMDSSGTLTRGTLTMTDGSISGNTASNSGGGLFVNGGTATITSGSISGNTATAAGGGLYVSSGTITITSGSVSGNKTSSDGSRGGGAYVSTGTLTINGGTFSGNSATYGGGIFTASGTITITSGSVSGNTATKLGGGLVINVNESVSGKLIMSGGSIANNKTTEESSYGGGILLYGTLDMSGGSISKNTTVGGGAIYILGGTATMTGGTITGNTASNSGGGVYVTDSSSGSGGTFTMSDSSTITGNSANFGGGVMVGGGTFTLNGGTLTDNTATSKGGGVYVYKGTFNLPSGSISSNTTKNGGGVYVDSDGAFTFSGGSLTSNTASESGGGVYVYNTGAFTMSGGTVTANNASSLGGGIYHAHTDNISISGSPVVTGNFKGATQSSDGTFSGGSTSNVYFASSGIFSVLSALTDTAKFGVAMANPGVFTSGLKGKGGIDNFSKDVYYDYNLALNENGEAVLSKHTHNFKYELSEDGTTIKLTCQAENCTLPSSTATLTIGVPVSSDGKATLTYDPEDFFGDLSSTVTYQTRGSDGNFGSASSTPPTGKGFYKASITYGGTTATITYGINCITYKDSVNGSVSGDTTAASGAVISPIISPDIGYEIDTLTVTRDDNSEEVTVTDNKSFVMPDAYVTVSASFKLANYEISFDVISGSVTVPESANYGDTIRLVITPDEGYGVLSLNVPGVTLNLVSRDTDTGVEVYTFDMPNNDIEINIQLAEIIIYTIFYRADDTDGPIYYRFYDDDESGFRMRVDAKMDNISCWAGQTWGVKDKEALDISFKVSDGSWTTKTCKVVNDTSNITNMDKDTAILVPGDENAFILAFSWGAYSIDITGNIVGIREDLGMKYYFVTKNTNSIEVPNPEKPGYELVSWAYQTGRYDSSNVITAGTDSTAITIKGSIEETTTFNAVWRRSVPIVTYDLDEGTWNRGTSETLTYGSTLTKPTETPVKDGYAFDHWVVKTEVQALKGSNAIRLLAGSEFDFGSTKIIENTRLRALWKHVHTYIYVPLSKANDYIPGVVSQNTINNYDSSMHLRLCSYLDNYDFESHSYNKDGKCICGAEKPTPDVTLEVTYNDRNSAFFTSKHKRNTQVSIAAPIIGTDKFVKWEYRAINGTEWQDLSTCPDISFAIPGNIRVNAVFQKLSDPELSLKAEHYKDDGLLFTFNYTLPSDCKVKDAAITFGDNYLLGYKTVERYLIPPEPKFDFWGALSDGLGMCVKVLGTINNITDKILNVAMDAVGIENEYIRKSLSLGATLLTGGPAAAATKLAGEVLDDVLDATGLGDTIIGDVVNLGMAVATGDDDDVLDAIESGVSIASKAAGSASGSNTNTDAEGRYELHYIGREDNLLNPSSYKNTLAYIMLTGQCVTLPGSNGIKFSRSGQMGYRTGMAYTGYLGVKDAYNGNRYFYVMGLVEYTKSDNTTHLAIIGPMYCTYNTTATPYVYTESPVNIISSY